MSGSKSVLAMKYLGAMVASLLVVAACAPASPPAQKAEAPKAEAPKAEAPRAEAPKTEAANPAAGGPAVNRLVMSLVPPQRETNDIRVTGNTDLWAIRPMYEYLVGQDPETGKFIPQLATEWKLEPDGKSLRFFLRKGVQFHNGFGEFTAKDVVFTWEDQKKDDTINGWLSFYQTVMQNVEVVNDYEVVIRMGREDNNLLNIISEAENGFEIRSKASADAQGVPTLEGKPYAGTGPYQYKERAQGQYIRFERVPYQHWRGMPDFPELEMRFQREASTRLAALQSGEVHFTVLPSDLRIEAEKKGFTTTSSTQAGLRTFLSYFCCSMKDPKDPSAGPLYPESPLWDVRVRRGLNKAINRDEMNKAFFEGKGEVMILPMHHPTRQGWDPSWVQRWPDEYGYDPAAAKALLAEAGYGPSKPYSITILVQPLPSIGPAEDLLEAIGGYWKAIGVQAELAQTDPNEIVTKQRQRQYTNHVRMQSTNSSLFTGMTGYFLMIGGRNNGYEDFDIDKYSLDAVSTFDEAKQEEAWKKVGELMYSKHTTVPLYWLPALGSINPKIVKSYTYSGNVTGTWTHTYTFKSAT
ncbi:MAG TPA: ABC transporter substrate-binding protein [Chloroflexota bacterium]|nr:ABC transporter substrate-binding protein [Chloroflexota bacterium]